MRWIDTALLVSSLVVAACGGPASTTTTGDAGTTTPTGAGTTAPPTALEDGGCLVVVGGDDERSWTAPDEGEVFASDHWQSEGELRVLYDFLAIQDDPSFEEIQEAGLAVFSFFSMSCVGVGGDTVAIFVSDATTRTHLPMAPGTYPISGGLFGAGDLPPGEFSASYLPATASMWGEEGSGSLTIDAWNRSRIIGSFTFVAEERFIADPRVVEVSGTFEFECRDSEVCR